MANLSNINNKFLVTTGGNVGIGTTAPEGKLDITGNIWLNSDNANAAYYLKINRAQSQDGGILLYGNKVLDWQLVNLANRDLNWYSYGASSSVMRLTSGGNLGIGTTSPGQKLEVYQAATNSQAYVTVQNNRSRNAAVLTQTTNGGFYTGTSIGTDTLCWQVYDASAGERMRIDSSGVVSVATGNLRLDGTAKLYTNNDDLTISSDDNGNGSSGRIMFRTVNQERMRITSDGMVGIGMTPGTAGSSTYMLQMYNSGSQCFLSLGNGTSGNGPLNGLVIGNDANNAYIVNREATSLIFATSDLNRMAILAGGNVGIGTTNPGATLDVDDDNTGKLRLLRNGSVRAEFSNNANEGELSLYRSNNSKYVYLSSYYNCYIDPQQTSAVVGIGGAGVGIASSGQGGNTTLDVQGPLRNKRVMRGWYHCGPITSTDAYRHIKTNLWMGGSPSGNTEYIMGGFEAKGYAYFGSYPGFGHGTCMFHNWSGSFASLQVANYGTAGFMQSPYVSTDGYCVIVLRHNTYMQPAIDFSQYYTPYPWRIAYVTAETTSPNTTGVY